MKFPHCTCYITVKFVKSKRTFFCGEIDFTEKIRQIGYKTFTHVISLTHDKSEMKEHIFEKRKDMYTKKNLV